MAQRLTLCNSRRLWGMYIDGQELHDLCIPPAVKPPSLDELVSEHLSRAKLRPRHPDSARFHEILAEVGKLHDQKQRDYGTPDSPFANLEASEEFGVPAWLGILVRMNDKMSRLKTFAKTRTLANESVIDNANDLAVYAIALRIAFEKWAKGLEPDPELSKAYGFKW